MPNYITLQVLTHSPNHTYSLTHLTTYSLADVAVDATGNVYIADSGNSRVRKVDSKSGIIETIAGIAGSGQYHINPISLTQLLT